MFFTTPIPMRVAALCVALAVFGCDASKPAPQTSGANSTESDQPSDAGSGTTKEQPAAPAGGSGKR